MTEQSWLEKYQMQSVLSGIHLLHVDDQTLQGEHLQRPFTLQLSELASA